MDDTTNGKERQKCSNDSCKKYLTIKTKNWSKEALRRGAAHWDC